MRAKYSLFLKLWRKAKASLLIGLAATLCTTLISSSVMFIPAQAHIFTSRQEISTLNSSVGLVTDEAGLTDLTWNYASYQGLLRAESELGVVGIVYTSTVDTDYAPNLASCVQDANDMCLSVGFLTSEAIWAAAQANPGVNFANVDSMWWDAYPDNLRGLWFDVAELGYLAGTLAGLMSQTDKVGVIGGMPIPVIDDFISGYSGGAQNANPDVQVQVEFTYDWSSETLGEDAAQNLIDAGADVIYNVAGPAGSAGIRYAAQQGVWVIGVDFDEYYTTFGGGSVAGSDKLLTSTVKEVDLAVFDTIRDQVDGDFSSGTLVYDLARLNSVSTATNAPQVEMLGLSPYHEAEASIPTDVKTALEAVHQSIINPSAGMVTDVGGLNDQGFNQASYQGLLRAESELGVAGTVYTSTVDTDYAPNLATCVHDINDLCLSVGFLTGNVIWEAAHTYAGVDFAIVDMAWDGAYPNNLRSMLFDNEELGYLVGALAGLMTQSDTIGAIGGMPIPPVDGFINGYRNGAQRLNPQLQVLVEYTNDFGSQVLGEQAAQNLIDAGADKLLTSAIKELDLAVFDTIRDEANGAFSSGTLVYDLARLSNAVEALASADQNHPTLADIIGLAPFHEAEADIPSEVISELETVQSGLVDGSIDASFSGKVYLPLSIKNHE